MSSVRIIRCEAESPETVLDRELKQFTASSPPQLLIAVDFAFETYWQTPVSRLALVALYHLIRRPDGVHVRVSVCAAENLQTLPERDDSDWLQQLALAWFELGQPLRLRPLSIPKPWGREIWYTGIEQRGVAAVCDGTREVPLPWLLAAAPQRYCHSLNRRLILLKILDPLPDQVFGDLYFELHRDKREVYVVTSVDVEAWPDGVGAIRFGFDAELRTRYGDDARFLSEYRAAVSRYRQLRQEVDSLLDTRRASEDIEPAQPVAATTLRRWLDELPASLREQEREARVAMEAFTGMLPLRVGDVVKVPRLVPHSLQHGVRTVEFQTPVYERLILSFAQKVLTQAHWDTDEALDVLVLDPPPSEPFATTAEGDGWIEERIVEFDDFEVCRLTLQGGAERSLRAPRDYSLCMAVGGMLQLGELTLAADEAVLLPPVWRGGRVVNPDASTRVLLMAWPRIAYP
ncbi:MAG: hypothetical protein ABW049_07145 [Spongiibacteraceae bacterium]